MEQLPQESVRGATPDSDQIGRGAPCLVLWTDHAGKAARVDDATQAVERRIDPPWAPTSRPLTGFSAWWTPITAPKPRTRPRRNRHSSARNPFPPGKMTVAMLEAMRMLDRPVTSAECATAMLTNGGFDVDGGNHGHGRQPRVGPARASKAGGGQIERAGHGEGRQVLWRVAQMTFSSLRVSSTAAPDSKACSWLITERRPYDFLHSVRSCSDA